MGILEVDDLPEARQIMDADPSILAAMSTYTLSPMIVGGCQSSQADFRHAARYASKLHMALPALPLLLALTLPLQAQEAPPAPRPKTLADMRDRYRPLLIFAPNGSEQLAAQRNLLLPHRAELLDRQVMLVFFFRKYAGLWDFDIETNLAQESELRTSFHVPPKDFTVILIGKDGGEKFRSHTPVTIEQLNHVIDAMPMRQQEMRPGPPR